jgi:alkylhydroperoxidase family enzyme
LAEQFEAARKRMGFIPNSQLIMQRRPKVLTAFAALGAAIWDPSGTVEIGLKRLIAHVASRAAACQYCMAHTAEGAMKVGIDAQKLEAVWDYQASPCSPLPRSSPRCCGCCRMRSECSNR